MKKISIIIPVYNCISYFDDCIRSILHQTYRDFELWLIDDGSTDGSGDFCDRVQREDARIRVVHTENHGAAHARKVGVAHATGEFYYFVDSDDTLPSDSLQRMVELSDKYPKADIVYGSCWDRPKWGRKTLTPEQYRKKMIEGRHNISVMIGKLFRSSIVKDCIPDIPKHLIMGEDMLANIHIAFATKEPIPLVRGKRVYHYLQHETSVSHRFKMTADYEHEYHQSRLAMIPAAERATYMPTLIHRRLRMLRRLLRNAQREGTVNELANSSFVEELKRDINATGYSFFNYPHPSLWKLLK